MALVKVVRHPPRPDLTPGPLPGVCEKATGGGFLYFVFGPSGYIGYWCERICIRSRYWVRGAIVEGVCIGGCGLSKRVGYEGCMCICIRFGYCGGWLAEGVYDCSVDAPLASGGGRSGGPGGARHRHVFGKVRVAGGAFRSQRRKPSIDSLCGKRGRRWGRWSVV